MRWICFTVPGPVRGKGRPRATTIGGHARMFTDSKTRNYEGEVKAAAADMMGAEPLFEGPLQVTMTARFLPPKVSKAKLRKMLAGFERPTKKPDADNILKIMDALNGVVFRDDAQVCSVSLEKVYAAVPSLHIRISTLDLTPAVEEAI